MRFDLRIRGVSASLARRRPQRKTAKRRLFELHSWFGFQLALIMSVVLFTGTIAVVADEIDWLLRAQMRVVPGLERVSWGAMEQAARRAAPADHLSVLRRGEGSYMAYRAVMVRQDRSVYFMHINQWTGEVTGTSSALTVQRFFRDLHRYLFMPSTISLPIVCSMGFVLLASLYTGLKTVGRVRSAATRIRFAKGWRVTIGDAHKAAGVWSLWFVVLIAITGIWYLLEFAGAAAGVAFEPPRPGPSVAQLERRGPVLAAIGADEAVARALAVFPDLEPHQVVFPSRLDGSIMVWGSAGNPLLRDRANRVSLDPHDGSIVQVVRSDDSGLLAFVNDLADPLHFGSFGELPSKLLWFVFGLALTGLSCSGVWLTWRRLRAIVISAAQLATLPILVGCMVFGVKYLDPYISRPAVPEPVAMHRGEVGPFNATVTLRQRRAAERGSLQLALCHREGLPLLRSTTLTLEAVGPIELKPSFFADCGYYEASGVAGGVWQDRAVELVAVTMNGVENRGRLWPQQVPSAGMAVAPVVLAHEDSRLLQTVTQRP